MPKVCPLGVAQKILKLQSWRAANVYCQKVTCLAKKKPWLRGQMEGAPREVYDPSSIFFRLSGTDYADVVLYIICERIIWTVLISQREDMRAVPDFIQEWFFTRSLLNGWIFTLSFSHKKEMGIERHMADVVFQMLYPIPATPTPPQPTAGQDPC